MHKMFLIATGVVMASVTITARDFFIHTFEKHQLTEHFWSEGAHFGDFNRDGHGDVVAGPFWYEGPDFTNRHEYAPATATFTLKDSSGKEQTLPGYAGALSGRNAYSSNFLAFSHDFNGDKWDDILILGFPGKESTWHENPRGRSGHWNRHVALEVTDNESPHFVDITGDGQPEIVCSSGGFFGYAEPDREHPERVWVFHRVTPKGPWQRFTHGMGVGDVNGDGRPDLLEKDGWWEQPATTTDDSGWEPHKFPFSPGGGAQMYAYDVDGDGDNDVITSLAAHGYGLAWYEHVKKEGQITFINHTFMNKKPSENKYGVKFSQLHAIDLVDINGDGLKDILTGKRYWAHGPRGDAEPNAPAVLYWFELQRSKEKGIDWIPHLIDDNSGIGTQVVAGDINSDGLPDVVVGNKKGVFAHLQNAKKVTRKEWLKARPKPLSSK